MFARGRSCDPGGRKEAGGGRVEAGRCCCHPVGSWHGPPSCAELEQKGQAAVLLTCQWVLDSSSQERGMMSCKVAPFSQRQHLQRTDCPSSPGEMHPSVLKKF